MQQLMYVGKRRLVWRDAAEPKLEADDDALVRPFVATRCDGDALYLLRDRDRLLKLGAKLGLLAPALASRGTSPFFPPFAYGHEGVAEVLKCGPSVEKFHAGDVVVVPWAVSCG